MQYMLSCKKLQESFVNLATYYTHISCLGAHAQRFDLAVVLCHFVTLRFPRAAESSKSQTKFQLAHFDFKFDLKFEDVD